MDKNLVVSLDEIKGIRLQCKKCGSEGMVSPTNPYLPRIVVKPHQRFQRVVRSPVIRMGWPEALWTLPWSKVRDS